MTYKEKITWLQRYLKAREQARFLGDCAREMEAEAEAEEEEGDEETPDKQEAEGTPGNEETRGDVLDEITGQGRLF